MRSFNRAKKLLKTITKRKGTNRYDVADSIKESFLRYSRAAQKQGFSQLYLLLSFDCDTPEDGAAAQRLHKWLAQHDIYATYAVPGAQLIEGADIYRSLADQGAEFMNHGAAPHTQWRGDRYWSTTFYHEMSKDEIVADINLGHQIVQQVIGKSPKGFRTPHFGTFQTEEQRGLVYQALHNLRYRFSSSTVPDLAFGNGPIIKRGDLSELPLSGTITSPYLVFDSWSYVQSPQVPKVKDEFSQAFIATIRKLLEWGVVGVLNWYMDPSHVHGSNSFYEALEFAKSSQIVSAQFEDLLSFVEQ
jgi:hypothetical protein